MSKQRTGIGRMSHCYVMLDGGVRQSTGVLSLGQRAFGHGSWAKRSLNFAVFVACSQSHLQVEAQVRHF